MIPAALAAVAILAAGAVVAATLERRLIGGAERGPVQPVRPRLVPLPPRPDSWLYAAGPVLAILGACWAMVVIPFGPGLVAADLGIGLFYYIVAADFVALGVALGGWGAATPNSVESCYRTIAQLVTYIVPLGLAVLGPAMMARSLSTVDIVEAQRQAGFWFVLVQPLGFALYLATALMQSYRAPFLEPFAARIDGGVLGAVGGWRGGAYRLALSGLLFVVSAMGAVLFFGGHSGPWLPPPAWMALKTIFVMILLVWTGRRFRLRSMAETIGIGWKVLVPLGLLNVLVVGALILLGVGQAPFLATEAP